MCSRYTVSTSPDAIAAAARAIFDSSFDTGRYNVAPSQLAPVVRTLDGDRRLEELRWGLVPAWAKDPKRQRWINARSETLDERPAFRDLLQTRRCLVPADGFYEWTGARGHKQPWHLCAPNHQLVFFAGLWDRFDRAGGSDDTFTIITTAASKPVASIHDRMPAILPEDALDVWLNGPVDEALDALAPWPHPLDVYKVGPEIGSPRAQGASLIAPARQLSLF